jgi:hypothetical protein
MQEQECLAGALIDVVEMRAVEVQEAVLDGKEL